tara:strand:- start:29 stop:211 length:183 start_codon:yes stop_codon:yes gene_type:complete
MWVVRRSRGVARSIITGFHPVDPGSNPGASTSIAFIRATAPYFSSRLEPNGGTNSLREKL